MAWNDLQMISFSFYSSEVWPGRANPGHHGTKLFLKSHHFKFVCFSDTLLSKIKNLSNLFNIVELYHFPLFFSGMAWVGKSGPPWSQALFWNSIVFNLFVLLDTTSKKLSKPGILISLIFWKSPFQVNLKTVVKDQ